MGNVCCSDERAKEHHEVVTKIKPLLNTDKHYWENAPKISVAQLTTLSDMDDAVRVISEMYDKHLPEECLKFMHDLKEKIRGNEFVMGPFHYPLTFEKYMGNYHRGEREGLGLTAYTDGSVFCGNYRADVISGQGILIVWVGGKTMIFTGDFNNNGPHGRCLKTTDDKKYHYDGKWDNGQKHGYGKETVDEMVYEGNFVHDLRDGFGIANWHNGDKYAGHWADGNPHGTGTFSWGDGREYIGTLENGVLHGKGVHTWPEGKKMYNGEYVQGKKHGYGVFTSENGARYEGEWRGGRQEGHGKLLNSIGALIKQGKWEHGVQTL